MEKSTIIEHEILSEIRDRKSGRAYSQNSVDFEKIKIILEAARWAPSSMNEQPWRYIIATKENPELYNKIFATLAESNQLWVINAPVLIVSLARKTFLRNGNLNRHAMYDTGAANSLLCVQASSIGLNAHQLGGFDYEKLKTALNVVDEVEIATVISIGYPGNLDALTENLRNRELAPRERYAQSELIGQQS